MRQLWFAALPAASLALGALAGCTTDPPPSCIIVDTSCAPLYAPTFNNVYAMTLKDTCGSTRASCHSAAGHQGGMSFDTEQYAYDALLAGRVMPGNPGCSKMIVRTDSPGAGYQMPPGDPLGEPERCALIQWIAAGAPAPGAMR
jgi:Planctomycete cytochrome C